jgi:fimbrial isopeptide formation D2 family protein/LPXTG-motif cell wall-anchored protein
MKTMKRAFALLLAVVMAMALAIPASAASQYKITVTNQNTENVSINGKEYKAYKLFDATYSGTTTGAVDSTAHSYSIKTDNWFYTNTAAKAALDEYFTFTASAGDNTTMLVTVKDGVTFNDAAAYALGEKLGDAIDAATTGGPTAAATANGSGEKAILDVGSAGYYIVTGKGKAVRPEGAPEEEVIAAVALTTTDPTAEIKAKVDAPSVDKTLEVTPATAAVADDPATTDVDESAAATPATYGKDKTASVGDTVKYKVESKVPDMTGYDKYFFVVNDTLSKGLTVTNANTGDLLNLVVKVGNTTLTAAAAADVTAAENANAALNTAKAGGDAAAIAAAQATYDTAVAKLKNTYTLTVAPNATDNEQTDVKIVINNFIDYKDNKGDAIVITYEAKVDNDAVIGVAGNPNTVTLDYSNNPNVNPKGLNEPGDDDDNVTGKTPESKTYTYVAGVKLIKVNPANEKLEGAEFKITGEKINTVVEYGTVYRAPKDGETATYYKLNDGTYTETAPNENTSGQYAEQTAGYVKDTERKVVETSETVTAQAFTKADGTLEFDGLAAGTYTITEITAPSGYNLLTKPLVIDVGCTLPTAEQIAAGNTTCTWTYTKNAAAGDNNAAPANANVTDAGIIEINVVNQSGPELPSTGGIGTKIFYTMGAVLVIGAGVVLVSRKRAGE